MPPVSIGWNVEPPVVLGLTVAGMLYLLAIGPWRSRLGGPDAPELLRAGSWFLALVILGLAIMSPLHALGDQYLLTAHMIQHMLMVLVVPPLLLFGVPPWLGAHAIRGPRTRAVVRVVANPILGFAAITLSFGIWHFPAFYQAALGNPAVHNLEHAVLLTGGLIGWLCVISPFPQVPALGYGGRMMYLFFAPLGSLVIGAILTLGDGVVYPVYALAPRVWGWPPLLDQQVAGLLMWVGGSAYYFLAITVVFFLWSSRREDRGEDERKAARLRAREAAMQRDRPVAG